MVYFNGNGILITLSMDLTCCFIVVDIDPLKL